MSQGHPAYAQRNAFATSSKLPDRTYASAATDTAAQPKFTRSAYARRPDPSHQTGPPKQFAPQYGPAAGPSRQSMEKESNVVAELTDDQRDEINEAVSWVHARVGQDYTNRGA